MNFGNTYRFLLFSKGTSETDWKSAFRQQEILNTRDTNNLSLQRNQLYQGKIKINNIKNKQYNLNLKAKI